MLVWKECRGKVNEAASSPREEVTSDNQALCAQKGELLEEFFRRYDWRLPVELTPSDTTFALVARARKKRSAEFIPLSRVASLIEARDTHGDHVRIKGAHGDLIFDPSRSLTKKIMILINLMGPLTLQSGY